MSDLAVVDSQASEGGGGKKDEMYATIGDDLFYDYYLQGKGQGHVPLPPP